jgi:hypothetical protein
MARRKIMGRREIDVHTVLNETEMAKLEGLARNLGKSLAGTLRFLLERA